MSCCLRAIFSETRIFFDLKIEKKNEDIKEIKASIGSSIKRMMFRGWIKI